MKVKITIPVILEVDLDTVDEETGEDLATETAMATMVRKGFCSVLYDEVTCDLLVDTITDATGYCVEGLIVGEIGV